MVVHHFHVMRAVRLPAETDAPPVIDTDGVLSLSASVQRLQTVARRNTKIFQRLRGMEIEQLAPRHAFDGVKPERDPVLKKGLCVVVAKRQDHIPAYDVLGIPSSVMDTNAKDSGPLPVE